MTACLAQTEEKYQYIRIVLSDSSGFHVFVEYELGFRFKCIVECLFFFIKDNMLDFLSLGWEINDWLTIYE